MVKFNYAEIELIRLGYSIDVNGICTNPKGKVLNGSKDDFGRLKIHVIVFGKRTKVLLHRLQAYQKFGDEIYKEGIMVRHLNGNPSDNSWNNLDIGTHSDNMMDQLESIRKKKASNASKKYSDELVIEIKNFHSISKSYKETMEKFNISSKGTLSYIINNR